MCLKLFREQHFINLGILSSQAHEMCAESAALSTGNTWAPPRRESAHPQLGSQPLDIFPTAGNASINQRAVKESAPQPTGLLFPFVF